MIDRHLYETIPATDCRKKCFVDFSTNDMEGTELENKLKEYSDYPTWLEYSAEMAKWPGTGGLSLKFRTANGVEGHNNQYKGFLQSVPLMRVEEMKLIEAEAAGMQDEARGKQLLEALRRHVIRNSYMASTSTISMATAATPASRTRFGGSVV